MADEKDRHINLMKRKHPDWDWDYWVAQLAEKTNQVREMGLIVVASSLAVLGSLFMYLILQEWRWLSQFNE